jgi:hypothetical protein
MSTSFTTGTRAGRRHSEKYQPRDENDGKVLTSNPSCRKPTSRITANCSDLEMLTSPGGRERTAGEYAELLEQAGFRLARIVPTRSPFLDHRSGQA